MNNPDTELRQQFDKATEALENIQRLLTEHYDIDRLSKGVVNKPFGEASATQKLRITHWILGRIEAGQ